MKSSFSCSFLLGLDIQADGVYLVHFKKKRQQFYFNKIAQYDLDAAIFDEEKIVNWEILTQALQKIVKEKGLTDWPVAISLPFHLIKFQRLQLPLALTEEQIVSEIILNGTRLWSDMNALAFDYATKLSADKTYAEIIVTATDKEYLTKYTNCITSAGFRMRMIDIDIYAIIRVLSYLTKTTRKVPNDEVNAIAFISTTTISIIVFHWHEIIICQSWKTKAFAQNWQLLNNKIIDFFSRLPNIIISQLFVCGKNAEINFIWENIHKIFQITTSFPNLFEHIKYSDDKHDFACENFFIASGLSMRKDEKW